MISADADRVEVARRSDGNALQNTVTGGVTTLVVETRLSGDGVHDGG
jgi:hypothetical protein